MKVGAACDVGRVVSTQPPWSTETSTTTARGFIVATISRVTSTGVLAPATSTAPITRSAPATIRSNSRRFECRVQGRADLGRHAPCDLRHGRQQRKPAIRQFHRLVGDADRAGVQQALRLRAIRREVQIGEQHLPPTQHRNLRELGFLDLHDQLGLAVDRRRTRH